MVSSSSSVCQHVCISVAPAGRISVKFDIRSLYENLAKNSILCSNRAKILGTLHEEFYRFFVAGDTEAP